MKVYFQMKILTLAVTSLLFALAYGRPADPVQPLLRVDGRGRITSAKYTRPTEYPDESSSSPEIQVSVTIIMDLVQPTSEPTVVSEVTSSNYPITISTSTTTSTTQTASPTSNFMFPANTFSVGERKSNLENESRASTTNLSDFQVNDQSSSIGTISGILFACLSAILLCVCGIFYYRRCQQVERIQPLPNSPYKSESSPSHRSKPEGRPASNSWSALSRKSGMTPSDSQFNTQISVDQLKRSTGQIRESDTTRSTSMKSNQNNQNDTDSTNIPLADTLIVDNLSLSPFTAPSCLSSSTTHTPSADLKTKDHFSNISQSPINCASLTSTSFSSQKSLGRRLQQLNHAAVHNDSRSIVLPPSPSISFVTSGLHQSRLLLRDSELLNTQLGSPTLSFKTYSWRSNTTGAREPFRVISSFRHQPTSFGIESRVFSSTFPRYSREQAALTPGSSFIVEQTFTPSGAIRRSQHHNYGPLEVQRGDTVKVLQDLHNGWLLACTPDGHAGLVPKEILIFW